MGRRRRCLLGRRGAGGGNSAGEDYDDYGRSRGMDTFASHMRMTGQDLVSVKLDPYVGAP